MLKNENIICISSIDWDFIWQGHQEIMSALAKNGNRVLFIENTGVRAPRLKDASRIRNRVKNWLKGVKGIRKEDENLYIYSPLILPFPYSWLARWINKHLILSVLEQWIKVMDFSDPIVWTFLPTPLTLDIADSINKKLFIYYCIDNFSASSNSTKKIQRSEIKVLRKVDLVFVTSGELYKYCSEYGRKVYKFPFGVNFEKFEKVRIENNSIIPGELKDVKTPIVGYVGGVHKWIDQDLIKYLAEKYPQYSFVFIGPLQTDASKLMNLKNVYFLGKKKHEDLPLFIKYFNIGIIPYLITEYTKNVYPTKLNEYLALGKPVISTQLHEIIEFNKEYSDVVRIADDKEKFGEYIDKIINENSRVLTENRIEAARNNSWGSRIEKMSCLVQKEIEIKKIDADVKWKERMISLYRITRRKMLKLAAGCFLLYFVFFNTPFIWFLASPLKISETPQKADVILVFGGGVGETGSPGKSTIERARYAAELYKQSYADKIIFSSGYTYGYNDAENMKLFAVSMGVREKDIILEQKANSTYENVKFSGQILRDRGWNKALLISSPYNMKRAELIFNKVEKGIKIVYTPVKNSQFYDTKGSSRRLEQAKAIMHEYFGIGYYLLKY
jgi:uncharacterized SAM-binding protein YcdF (DUF218 family)/glycosyltransferase involved in cell wall biosynthesis